MFAEVAQVGPGTVCQLPRQRLERVQDHAGAVGEHLGGHHVRRRVLGLVREPSDPAVAVHLDDAVVRGLLDGHPGGHDGEVGVAIQVRGYDVGEVEPVDVVGAEHQEHVRRELTDELSGLENGVRVALVPSLLIVKVAALLGGEETQPTMRAVQVPRPPAGHHVDDGLHLILRGHPHVVDRRVAQIAQRKVDEAVDAGERQGRLGAALGENLHPAAFSTGQHQRQHRGATHLRPPARRNR